MLAAFPAITARRRIGNQSPGYSPVTHPCGGRIRTCASARPRSHIASRLRVPTGNLGRFRAGRARHAVRHRAPQSGRPSREPCDTPLWCAHLGHGAQGRSAHVCAQVLPALPTRGAAGRSRLHMGSAFGFRCVVSGSASTGEDEWTIALKYSEGTVNAGRSATRSSRAAGPIAEADRGTA